MTGYLTPIESAIPAALDHLPGCVWGTETDPKSGKPAKRPAHPRTRRPLSTNAPGTWPAFAEARQAYRDHPQGAAGLGVLMGAGMIGVDIDGAFLASGELKAGAAAIINANPEGYWETSPSGRGVRGFVRGKLPGDFTNRKATGNDGETFGLEVYGGSAGRFLTVTGQRLATSRAEPETVTPEGLATLATFRKQPKTESAPLPIEAPDRSIDDLSEGPELSADDLCELAPYVRDFLTTGATDDRSGSVREVARALRWAGLSGPQVLTWLQACPTTWQVALDHRRGDDAAALEYLQNHHVVPAVAEDWTPATVVALFEVLAPELAPEGLLIYASMCDVDTNPPPPRRWAWTGYATRGAVTGLFALGGVGKSMLCQQAATAVANGVPLLGIPTERGPALALFAEDDPDELRRRQSGIFRTLGVEPQTGAAGLYIAARAGQQNALVTFNSDNLPRPTPLFKALQAEARKVRPVLIVLDNIAQMFTGNENDRAQVTAFCNLLTGLALDVDAAILLVGHTAKGEGSQFSGSTAWDAAVRARLFLSRGDDGVLTLAKAKSNYAALDSLEMVRADTGGFVLHRAGDVAQAAFPQLRRELLQAVHDQNALQVASSNTPTARNYLLTLMGVPRAKRAPYADALRRLIVAGEVTPNTELGWKKPDRHKATGLAIAPGVALDTPATPEVSLAFDDGEELT